MFVKKCIRKCWRCIGRHHHYCTCNPKEKSPCTAARGLVHCCGGGGEIKSEFNKGSFTLVFCMDFFSLKSMSKTACVFFVHIVFDALFQN